MVSRIPFSSHMPPKAALAAAAKKASAPEIAASMPTGPRRIPTAKQIHAVVPTVAASKTGANQEVYRCLQRALDMGVENLRQEFRDLAKYTAPGMTVSAFTENQSAGKNRYQDVPCQDQFRVILKWPGLGTDYIHANYVSTPWSPRRFICTQGPLDPTINEFWVMIIQEEVVNIIMLCSCIEMGKNKCAEYWPSKPGEVQKLEGVNIEIRNESVEPMSEEDKDVIYTRLSVKVVRDNQTIVREVRHYQWTSWPDRGVPPVKLTCMELLMRVRGSKTPICVHCSAGIGRTGTVVAIEFIMERLANGLETVAMNELLKTLRNQRAWSIQNDLQYLYVHRILIAYFTDKHKSKHPGYNEPEFQAKLAKFLEDYSAATGN